MRPARRIAPHHGPFVESGREESLDHLVAHLETVGPYRRPHRSIQAGGPGPVTGLHRLDRRTDDVGHHAPPPRMHGGTGPVVGVVEQHRHTVGRRDGHGNPAAIGHHRIDSLEHLSPLTVGAVLPVARDCSHLYPMHLMGSSQTVEPQGIAQPLPIGSNPLGGFVGIFAQIIGRERIARYGLPSGSDKGDDTRQGIEKRERVPAEGIGRVQNHHHSSSSKLSPSTRSSASSSSPALVSKLSSSATR